LNEHKAKEKIYRESVAREYLLSEKIEFLELQEKLEQIIETLPDRRREIYLLSRKEGLSHKEIAVKLDISEKTVEYHITQSLSEIKKKMREIGLLAMLYFYFFL
jgi:RNA polymerase sigma-70 factor (ECF subfamily)